MHSRTELLPPPPQEREREPAWLALVRERVAALRFGTVQITVHEGRVTQVDATLRTRLSTDEGSVS